MIAWYFLAIVAAVLSAFTSLIAKHLLRKEHATSFTAITTIITTIISLAFVPYANFNLTVLQYVYIYAASTVFLTSSLLVARLFRHEDVSSIAPITSTLPIILVTLLTFSFINEVLSIKQYAGIIILIVAIYLFLRDTNKSIPVQFVKKNLTYFFVAALLAAVGTTILKYTLSSVSAYSFLIISGIFTSVNMIAFVLVRFRTLRFMIAKLELYKLETLVYSLASVGASLFYFYAIKPEPVSVVYPLRNGISILLTVFASGIILKEKVLKRIPIAIIMIAAMYLLVS